jgi:hypothetical protein
VLKSEELNSSKNPGESLGWIASETVQVTALDVSISKLKMLRAHCHHRTRKGRETLLKRTEGEVKYSDFLKMASSFLF